MAEKNRLYGFQKIASGEKDPRSREFHNHITTHQMPRTKNNQFTAIELGTHSIKVLLAEDEPDTDTLTILNATETDSLKVIKGEINNLDMVEEKLKYALQKQKEDTGVDIRDTYTALVVSGNYISQVSIPIDVMTAGRDKVITQEDINHAVKNARLMDISPKNEVLSTSVRFHTLADGRQVLDPIGLTSESMQTSVQLIQAHKVNLATPVNLLNNILERELNDIFYAPMVLGKACLMPEDVINNGHIFIDIGAGVTSCALFTAAGCHSAFQITVGTEQAANDLAIAFKLPIQYARNLLAYMSTLNWSIVPDDDAPDKIYTVDQGPGMPAQHISAQAVTQVLSLRFSEIFEIISTKLMGEDAWRFAGGEIHLSGGATRIPGITTLAQNVFQQPVVLARPSHFKGPADVLENPTFICPIGALRNAKESLDLFNYERKDTADIRPSGVGSIKSILKSIFNF